MKFQPHGYQKKAVQFLIERAHGGLFASPGAGKSAVTLAVFKILRNLNFAKRLLVLAPLRPCYSVWGPEIAKWDDFRDFSVSIMHGDNRCDALKGTQDVTICNYDTLPWLAQQDLKTWPWDMLVIDELSKVKSTGTQRFKLLRKLLPKFKRRYGITGSPAANSLMDLFGEMYCIDTGESFGAYVTGFRLKYFSQPAPYLWIPKPNAEDEIFARIAPRVLQINSDDYLDLPELITIDISVDLPPKALKIYKQMESTLRLDFEKGRILAANAAVASGKVRQICNGGVYHADGISWEHIHDAKTAAVVDLVDELQGQPALIAYEFKHDLARLKQALGEDTPHIGGDVSPAKSNAYIAAWNRGELPILLGHPASIAHGLNLQGAGRAVIWHSLPWNYEYYDQFIRRVWRQGQKDKVFVYHIKAKDTVDDAVLAALRRKEKGQQALFDALKSYWDN